MTYNSSIGKLIDLKAERKLKSSSRWTAETILSNIAIMLDTDERKLYYVFYLFMTTNGALGSSSEDLRGDI